MCTKDDSWFCISVINICKYYGKCDSHDWSLSIQGKIILFRYITDMTENTLINIQDSACDNNFVSTIVLITAKKHLKEMNVIMIIAAMNCIIVLLQKLYL